MVLEENERKFSALNEHNNLQAKRAFIAKSNTGSIWSKAIEDLTFLFSEAKGQRVCQKLIDEVMGVVQKFRRQLMDQSSGLASDKAYFTADELNQVKNSCQMMKALGLYQSLFKERFLARTAEFYSVQSLQQLKQKSVADYLTFV